MPGLRDGTETERAVSADDAMTFGQKVVVGPSTTRIETEAGRVDRVRICYALSIYADAVRGLADARRRAAEWQWGRLQAILVRGPGGIINVADVVGSMTGLNMTKYDLQLDVNARGWRIVRRPRR